MKNLVLTLVSFFVVSSAVAGTFRPEERSRFSFRQNANLMEMVVSIDKIKSESLATGVSMRVPVQITTLDAETKMIESKLSFLIRENGKDAEEARNKLKQRLETNLAIYLMAKCNDETLLVDIYPSNIHLGFADMSSRAADSPLGRVFAFTNSQCRQSSQQKAAEILAPL